MIVYLITNTVTGKKYVGMTIGTTNRRFRGHCRSAARNPRVPVHLAIAKYGSEAFTIKVLARATSREKLCRLEKSLIERFDCRVPRGYNLTPGGDGMYPGLEVSKKTRKLISTRGKDAWARLSPEERAERGRRVSAAKKGMKVTWVTGDKLRGRPRPKTFKKKVSEGMKRYMSTLPPGEMSRRSKCQKSKAGIKLNLTPAQRARRSEAARKGALQRYQDPEQRRLTAERTRAQHARTRAQHSLVFVG